MIKKGIFTISLDFEKFWGVAGQKTIENYGENILNVKEVVEKLLTLFKKYDINVTWAFVGFMGYENIDELKNAINFDIPKYKNIQQSTYTLLSLKEDISKYLFLSDNELEKIKNNKGQELASHSFSHIYCYEDGVTVSDFINDVKAFKIVANKIAFTPKSFIFPRNQVKEDCINVLHQNGYFSYRGNEENYGFTGNTLIHKIYRQLNLLFNISGHNTFKVKSEKILNIKGSSFLHPVSTNFKIINYLRKKRIQNAMTYAAKNNEIYHLWWHPHNFGANMDKNLGNLEALLIHYISLKEKYGYSSMNMEQIAEIINS